jgi:hypothetical protein
VTFQLKTMFIIPNHAYDIDRIIGIFVGTGRDLSLLLYPYRQWLTMTDNDNISYSDTGKTILTNAEKTVPVNNHEIEI